MRATRREFVAVKCVGMGDGGWWKRLAEGAPLFYFVRRGRLS